MKLFLYLFVLAFFNRALCCEDVSLASFNDLESDVIRYVSSIPMSSYEEGTMDPRYVQKIRRYLRHLTNKDLLGDRRLTQDDLAEILRVCQTSVSNFINEKACSPMICYNLQLYYLLTKKEGNQIVLLSQFKNTLWDNSGGDLEPWETDTLLRSKDPKIGILLPRRVKENRNIQAYIRHLVDLSNEETLEAIISRPKETIQSAFNGDKESCQSIYRACRDYYRRGGTQSLLEKVVKDKIVTPPSLWDAFVSLLVKVPKARKDHYVLLGDGDPLIKKET